MSTSWKRSAASKSSNSVCVCVCQAADRSVDYRFGCHWQYKGQFGGADAVRRWPPAWAKGRSIERWHSRVGGSVSVWTVLWLTIEIVAAYANVSCTVYQIGGGAACCVDRSKLRMGKIRHARGGRNSNNPTIVGATVLIGMPIESVEHPSGLFAVTARVVRLNINVNEALGAFARNKQPTCCKPVIYTSTRLQNTTTRA